MQNEPEDQDEVWEHVFARAAISNGDVDGFMEYGAMDFAAAIDGEQQLVLPFVLDTA